MAYITKRGSSYSVRYTYQDEHGKSCDKWESFPTKEEAVKRQKQIEHELATGNFLIPSTVTVAEFLMDWLPKQCSKHKWAPKTYQSNLALIQNLIIPYIGEMQMQKLRPYHIEALYDTLSKTPCGQYVGGKRRDLSPKQQKRTLSGTTLHEVHQLLHNSFLLAVEWGILIKSPVPVEAPKKTTQERSIWEVEEMRAALDSMEDPILHLAVHLTLVGALREGEVAVFASGQVALTPGTGEIAGKTIDPDSLWNRSPSLRKGTFCCPGLPVSYRLAACLQPSGIARSCKQNHCSAICGASLYPSGYYSAAIRGLCGRNSL